MNRQTLKVHMSNESGNRALCQRSARRQRGFSGPAAGTPAILTNNPAEVTCERCKAARAARIAAAERQSELDWQRERPAFEARYRAGIIAE